MMPNNVQTSKANYNPPVEFPPTVNVTAAVVITFLADGVQLIDMKVTAVALFFTSILGLRERDCVYSPPKTL